MLGLLLSSQQMFWKSIELSVNKLTFLENYQTLSMDETANLQKIDRNSNKPELSLGRTLNKARLSQKRDKISMKLDHQFTSRSWKWTRLRLPDGTRFPHTALLQQHHILHRFYLKSKNTLVVFYCIKNSFSFVINILNGLPLRDRMYTVQHSLCKKSYEQWCK